MFKCKDIISEKIKEEYEEEFAKTGKIFSYDLCNCNEIICSSCKELEIEYKHVIPKTQAEFEALKEKGVSYCKGQYESTKQDQFHKQFYFQFKEKERQIAKLTKDIFNHRAMNFPKYLNELVGPWEFGKYRYFAPICNQLELYQKLAEKQLQVHDAGIKRNNMLLNRASVLEVRYLILNKLHKKIYYTNPGIKSDIEKYFKQLYWHHHFPEYKQRYLRNYPNSKELWSIDKNYNLALFDEKEELLCINNQLHDQIINLQNTNDDLSTQLQELT
ncbi:25973_t:CDS:2 [Gigaspora margarita]|uniref:25973_t:CDS:1 n=1 Tax=Gigaspora margarita TaxID=4874 RepID=A0ABN7VZP8_GIGMA|nr:25973_t:CDS:2 [Gigaspora margarita]